MTMPNGFIARCRCGKIVSALDYKRTERQESGSILGKWLHEGCQIEPKFEDTWSAKIESCDCTIGVNQ